MRGVTQKIGLAVALSVLSEGVTWAQCAMCRTLLATPEGQRLVGSLRVGIAILLAAPVATFAAVAYAAVRSQRQLEARRKTAVDYSAPPGEDPASVA